MVGIDSVPETEGVSQERGAQQNRLVMERDNRPNPGANVNSG